MKNLIILIAIFLSGCATSTKMILPSGVTGYSIECGAYSQECYKKAGELCPNGYDIVSDQTTQRTFFSFYGGGSNPNYVFLIQCR